MSMLRRCQLAGSEDGRTSPPVGKRTGPIVGLDPSQAHGLAGRAEDRGRSWLWPPSHMPWLADCWLYFRWWLLRQVDRPDLPGLRLLGYLDLCWCQQRGSGWRCLTPPRCSPGNAARARRIETHCCAAWLDGCADRAVSGTLGAGLRWFFSPGGDALQAVCR